MTFERWVKIAFFRVLTKNISKSSVKNQKMLRFLKKKRIFSFYQLCNQFLIKNHLRIFIYYNKPAKCDSDMHTEEFYVLKILEILNAFLFLDDQKRMKKFCHYFKISHFWTPDGTKNAHIEGLSHTVILKWIKFKEM